MTTAFVLWGGGSLGAVQVGMLRALADAGIRADLVVGASVGALNGTYYAAQPDGDGVRALERVWLDLQDHEVYPLTRSQVTRALRANLPSHPLRAARAATGADNDVFPFRPAGLAGGVLGRSNYLFGNRHLARFLHRVAPVAYLEQTRLPVTVLATEVVTGEAVAMTAGRVVPALVASAAIPAVYPPVRMDGHVLMDGGLARRTTLDLAIAAGADEVYLLAPGLTGTLPALPSTAMAMALHAYALFTEQREVTAATRARARALVHLLPTVSPPDVLPVDFGHTSRLIERSAEITAAWLAGGRPPAHLARGPGRAADVSGRGAGGH